MTQIPGQHSPTIKNRSSKQLICLTKVKPIERSVSYETLKGWAANGNREASKELARRNKKHAKDKKQS